MKNKKFLSVLVTLAVLFGCMNGVVLADDEVDEIPETSEEQIEETEEEIETTEATETESEETEETDSEQPEESEQDAEVPDGQDTEESDAVEIEFDEYDSADDVAADAYYINRTWNGTEVVSESEPYTGTSVKLPESGGAINGWFYVDENITVNSRLLIASGHTVNLVLVDGVTVTVIGGIDVPDGATLHIYGQSRDSGNLIIKNVAENLAGIGGNSSHNNGDIFIHGGDIDITMGDRVNSNCGAGIGNGNYSGSNDCGTIDILGGNINVEVSTNSSSAGIGGGAFNPVGKIYIYGGVIFSNGGNCASGIGSGSNATSNYIEINGGEVNAQGGDSAAGIGTGNMDYFGGCNIGTIIINGGTVNANGGNWGAGIGSGKYKFDIEGTIQINGGNVISYGGTHGAGIGLGANLSSGTLPSTDVSISIIGGSVLARGIDSGSSGIGTGLQGSFESGTVEIRGGSVSLYAGLGSRYIGSDLPLDSLLLGSEMCVSVDNVLVLSAERVNSCFGTAVSSESYVKISACEHVDGDWAYVDDDNHSFTCHYCSYVDYRPHTISDGACIDCAHVFAEGPAFIGHQMLLSGDIVIRYWVTMDNDISDSSYITFEGQGMTSATHYPLTQGVLPDHEELTTFYVDLHINSIQMAEEFTPTLHYPGADSEKSIEGSAFSAQDYLHYGKTHFAVGSYQRKIVDALADYGYYAQKYLSLQNDWTIGEDYAEIDRSSTSYTHDDVRNRLTGYEVESEIDPDLFESCSFALRFGDQLTMNIYFTPKEGATIDIDSFRVFEYSDYTVSYTGGRYVVTISGISVSGCDRAFRVIYNDVDFVSVSPLSFAYAMLSQSSYSPKTMAGKDLVCALYYLYEACRSN